MKGISEPMESLEHWINGKFASLDSKCRKVTTHKCPNINVLNVEMEPRMGDGENWTNEKFGKLNQWKICFTGFLSAERSPHINVLTLKWKLGWVTGKTEPKKNSEHWINRKFASLDSKCRKVTTHKHPRINVLNIEMEPRMGDGENWTNGKFRTLNQQGICISGF